MKFWLGATDNSWFDFLKKRNPEDVNFWQPSGNVSFRVLSAWEPFFFKLKRPRNHIGGVGFFSSHTKLPLSVAWETFRERNGCITVEEFRRKIWSYRKDSSDPNPQIGCIVLTNPIFFKEEDWIRMPDGWGAGIVQGKSYDNRSIEGMELWQRLSPLIERYILDLPAIKIGNSIVAENDAPLYSNSVLTKIRLGQGAFRVSVTDAYQRRCSITGEKTLPVLEAAHIKPYASSGPHSLSNGILLRSDMHKLFDAGYLTVTPELRVEVSSRIKEEFQNGREYYKYHGESLLYLPPDVQKRPDKVYIDWHNENVYRS